MWTRSASCSPLWGRRSAQWCCSTPLDTWRTTSRHALLFTCWSSSAASSASFTAPTVHLLPVLELVGLCSFSLVGFWYTNPEAVAGARKVLLMTHIAAMACWPASWSSSTAPEALCGRSECRAQLYHRDLPAHAGCLVAKSVQVPIHTWIPESHAAPTPVSALLHAACYVTSGVYLAARMHSFGVWPVAWGAHLYG